jgi:hypothetical protein
MRITPPGEAVQMWGSRNVRAEKKRDIRIALFLLE